MSDGPWELPADWRWVTLGDVAEIISGGTPKKTISQYWDGDVAWATPADLRHLTRKTISTTSRTITEAGLRHSSASLLPPGSVLLSSRAPIGHVAINTIPMATNQGFKNLVPKEDIGSSYIYYWLKANKDLLESHGNGATFKEISKSSVSRIPIPLPPLSEQRRISGILDKALRVENLWYQRNAAMEDLGISTFRETVKNNKSSIRYTKLGDLGKWRSGGTPPRHREEYFQGEIPWISSGELGNLYIDSARSRISEKAIRETSAKNVPPGSLMIGMYDTAALKSSIASIHCSCNQAVAFSSLDTKIVDTLFVYYAILDQKKSLLENRRGIRQKNLNLSIVKDIEVQLPNLSVQQEFSSLIRRIKNLYCTTEKTSSELFSSLQHHAFQGKL